MDDFESYINAIDSNYYSEDVNVTGYVFKLKIPQFNIVNRSAYVEGTKYMKRIVKHHVQNVHISTNGMCFMKNVNYSTVKNYTENFRDFIRNQKNDME